MKKKKPEKKFTNDIFTICSNPPVYGVDVENITTTSYIHNNEGNSIGELKSYPLKNSYQNIKENVSYQNMKENVFDNEKEIQEDNEFLEQIKNMPGELSKNYKKTSLRKIYGDSKNQNLKNDKVFLENSIYSSADIEEAEEAEATNEEKIKKKPKLKLKEALLKAFDEGSESPYDLREQIVAKIEKRTKDNSDNSITYSNLKIIRIGQKICDTIKHKMNHSAEGLQVYNAMDGIYYLAGGSIIRSIVDSKNASTGWNNQDLDVFCKENSAIPLLDSLPFVQTNEIPNYFGDFKNNIKSYRYKQINLIIGNFDSIWDIFKDFDFNFLCIGFDLKKQHNEDGVQNFYYRDHTVISDLINRKITKNPLSDRPIKKGRIQKYISRGFSDGTYMIEKPIYN